ncbi:hypothetical protein DAEQUDRAFT_724674 [Daedalea quercina L-15889]|uniref:Uncharacterized protein n=1 Tax=Daedalea quercina L-15889 TaxID=1314783 RepID=A0A165RLZ5_9APHY|nr:hypothetical protein DAEQUDRAFT_724674 [Daedalea quercina L-15889]
MWRIRSRLRAWKTGHNRGVIFRRRAATALFALVHAGCRICYEHRQFESLGSRPGLVTVSSVAESTWRHAGSLLITDDCKRRTTLGQEDFESKARTTDVEASHLSGTSNTRDVEAVCCVAACPFKSYHESNAYTTRPK